MISKLAALALTITALVPVGVAYSLVAALGHDFRLAAVLLGVCIVLSIACWAIWCHALNKMEMMTTQITAAEIADHENVAFLVLYLLPLLTDYSEGLPSWRVWIPVATVVVLAIMTSYSYHFNPLLGVMGWHFYKVTTPEGITYVMISKRHLQSVREKLTVGQLTEYILVDLKG